MVGDVELLAAQNDNTGAECDIDYEQGDGQNDYAVVSGPDNVKSPAEDGVSEGSLGE